MSSDPYASMYPASQVPGGAPKPVAGSEQVERMKPVLPYPDPNARDGGYTETFRPALPGNPTSPADPNNRTPGVVGFRPPIGQYGPPNSTGGPGGIAGTTGGPDPNSMQAIQNYAKEGSENVPTIQNSPGVTAGYQVASGQTLQNDPSIGAAVRAFNQYQLPQIQNQMAISGLGQSNAAANAVSLGLGQQMAPMMQAALAREQESLGRGAQATEAEINRRQQANQFDTTTQLNAANQFAGLGNQQYQQQLGQIGASDQFGNQQQAVQQNQYDAAYQDYLRRQGLSEQATFGPFGQLVPSAFGSKSLTSKQ